MDPTASEQKGLTTDFRRPEIHRCQRRTPCAARPPAFSFFALRLAFQKLKLPETQDGPTGGPQSATACRVGGCQRLAVIRAAAAIVNRQLG